MGNLKSCMSGTTRRAHAHEGSIARRWGSSANNSLVPDQDPLLPTLTRRIVRAEIGRDFEISAEILGTGYSGAVRSARQISTRERVAVKQFSKRRLKAHKLKLLQSEVEVYLRVDHPNICRLLHAYEGKHDVWLVMELCGCELYGRLCERKAYREIDAVEVMLQMLQAVNYLHSQRIVHRDLKLENWMYGATERDDRLKLIDFGFSRVIASADETLDMPCGTLHYTSPEVLARKYTSQCDMWSLGVICYMLLLGRPPFRGSNNLKIAKAILHSEFPKDGRWEAISSDAQDFIQQLLNKDASLRLDAARAIVHPWITRARGPGSVGSQMDIGVDTLKTLRKFAQGSHLRRAALTLLAYSLTSRELQDLEQTFLAFDESGNGTITLDQLAKVMQDSQLDVSSEEVERIFNSFDVSNDEEMHYTAFIAAMLATRVQLNEDKVHAAFEAFDHGNKGYITADGLVKIYDSVAQKDGSGRGLSKEEAEAWIREVDYKGNGHIGYDEFLAALQGKNLWCLPSLEDAAESPVVTIFEHEAVSTGRPRVLSDTTSNAAPGNKTSVIRHRLAAAMIDGGAEIDPIKPLSFTNGAEGGEVVKLATINCKVDEGYFPSHR